MRNNNGRISIMTTLMIFFAMNNICLVYGFGHFTGNVNKYAFRNAKPALISGRGKSRQGSISPPTKTTQNGVSNNSISFVAENGIYVDSIGSTKWAMLSLGNADNIANNRIVTNKSISSRRKALTILRQSMNEDAEATKNEGTDEKTSAKKKKKKTSKKKKKSSVTSSKKKVTATASKSKSKSKSKTKSKKTTSKKKEVTATKMETEKNLISVTSSAEYETGIPQLPSLVMDYDGETPELEVEQPDEVTEEDIPELNYDEKSIPVPHQPWRRGDTDGCHDPIDAPWRIHAESIIANAATSVGGKVTDITWHMAAVVVTIDEDFSQVMGPSGPEIRILEPSAAQYFDPDDPEPNDDYGMYAGEEDGRILDENGAIVGLDEDPYAEQEFNEETGELMPPKPRPTRDQAVRNITYKEFEKWISDGLVVQMQDRDDRIRNKISLAELEAEVFKANEVNGWGFTPEELEERAAPLRARWVDSEELAEFYPDEFAKVGWEQPGEKLAMPTIEREDGIDTNSLSIISKAILDALADDTIEDELQILSRHEVILTSPCSDDFLETQRQFDNQLDNTVYVQTQDPFGSNRVLTGKLMQRDALDVILNIDGRMVTIPLSMIEYVMVDDPEFQESDDEYDDEYNEEDYDDDDEYEDEEDEDEDEEDEDEDEDEEFEYEDEEYEK